jgi:hypothetical protein
LPPSVPIFGLHGNPPLPAAGLALANALAAVTASTPVVTTMATLIPKLLAIGDDPNVAMSRRGSA